MADSFSAQHFDSEWEHLFRMEDDHERRAELEVYLDKGHGECHLRRADVAQLVENNFRQFSGDRYELRSWVIMPNHVHVLFKVGSDSPDVGDCWCVEKTYRKAREQTAGKSRCVLGGEIILMVFMRNADHERQTIHYIENNPTKAKAGS